MKEICNFLLSKPLLLIKWGYEFPVLNDAEFSFNIKATNYCGRVIIQRKEANYTILFEKTNKLIVFSNYRKVIGILKKEIAINTDLKLPL